jgi:hypothetical protein
MEDRPKITHVAIRFEGVVYALPEPNRHHDVIKFIVNTTGATHVDAYGDDQGFQDASGTYLTRQQALISALLNNQVKDPSKIRLGMLFSEDIW